MSLACNPTSPASLTITIGPGSLAQLMVLDTLAYGSLPGDTVDPLVKMGINISSTSFSLATPTTSGQSTNYLIEASFLESDVNPVVLPYYNAANPAQPYSGPNNSGVPQNTQRIQRVQLQLKSGAPAPTGQQQTPAVDAGWVGLYIVGVSYGQSQVVASNISVSPAAPFLNWKLPQLKPGFASGIQTFTTSGIFIVPPGVTQVEVEIWGSGSGSFCINWWYTKWRRSRWRVYAQADCQSFAWASAARDCRLWRDGRNHGGCRSDSRRHLELRNPCKRERR